MASKKEKVGLDDFKSSGWKVDRGQAREFQNDRSRLNSFKLGTGKTGIDEKGEASSMQAHDSESSNEDEYHDENGEVDEIGRLRISCESNQYTLDNNQDLIWKRCPLDTGRHNLDPGHDLGTLDKLPVEVLTDVFDQCDIKSLTDFRRVNQRANKLIDSLPKYCTVVTHAANAIRGMLVTDIAYLTTLSQLYFQLCQYSCSSCGGFGGYLYLLTCRRLCYLCLQTIPAYKPMRKADALRDFGLQPRHLRQVRRMRLRPGCYTAREWSSRQELTLCDSDSTRDVGIATHGSLEEMDAYVIEVERRAARKSLLTERMKSEKRLALHRRRRDAGVPTSFDRRDRNDTFRFMPIVRFPYFDRQKRAAEWGFLCADCIFDKGVYETGRPNLHLATLYTSETFVPHLKQQTKGDDDGLPGSLFHGKDFSSALT